MLYTLYLAAIISVSVSLVAAVKEMQRARLCLQQAWIHGCANCSLTRPLRCRKNPNGTVDGCRGTTSLQAPEACAKTAASDAKALSGKALLRSDAVVQGWHLFRQACCASAGALDHIVGQRRPQIAVILQNHHATM